MFFMNQPLLFKKKNSSPSESRISGAEDVQKHLLFTMQVIILLLTAGTLIIISVINDSDSLRRIVYSRLTISLMAVVAGALYLNFRGYSRLSAVLTVAAAAAGPWLSLVFDPGIFQGDYFPLAYTAVSVMISSIFLPLLPTVLIAVLQCAALIAVVILSPASNSVNSASFLILLFFISALSIIANYIVAEDMKESENQKKQLHDLTFHDHLTGLFNRRYFEMTMDREIVRAAERNISIGIILIDIDRFKQLNDTFGHAAGDAVLEKIGSVLSEEVRITDSVCRYGGDEFVLLFHDADRNMLKAAAEKILEQVRSMKTEQNGKNFARTTISLGAALFPEHGSTRESLLEAADKALYRAKENGRDCAAFVDENCT